MNLKSVLVTGFLGIFLAPSLAQPVLAEDEQELRSFTIDVDTGSAPAPLSSWIHPGDVVDIFWTGDISGVLTTRLIEPSILVAAVGEPSGGTTEVTLLVARAEQVARLVQGNSAGKLSFAVKSMASPED